MSVAPVNHARTDGQTARPECIGLLRLPRIGAQSHKKVKKRNVTSALTLQQCSLGHHNCRTGVVMQIVRDAEARVTAADSRDAVGRRYHVNKRQSRRRRRRQLSHGKESLSQRRRVPSAT